MNELSERWHMRVEADGTPDIVRDWCGNGWNTEGFITERGIWVSITRLYKERMHHNNTSVELTLEQFRQFVLPYRLWKLNIEK